MIDLLDVLDEFEENIENLADGREYWQGVYDCIQWYVTLHIGNHPSLPDNVPDLLKPLFQQMFAGMFLHIICNVSTVHLIALTA